MQQTFTSIPFKTESSHGLSYINGIAKFSPAGIVLEFEAKWFGLISAGVKEIRIPLAEILDVKFRKGFLKIGSRIEVRLNSYATLAELPNDDGRLKLKVERADREQAAAAVVQLQKELGIFQEQLPPPHTPIGELFQDESEDETRRLSEPGT